MWKKFYIYVRSSSVMTESKRIDFNLFQKQQASRLRLQARQLKVQRRQKKPGYFFIKTIWVLAHIVKLLNITRFECKNDLNLFNWLQIKLQQHGYHPSCCYYNKRARNHNKRRFNNLRAQHKYIRYYLKRIYYLKRRRVCITQN